VLAGFLVAVKQINPEQEIPSPFKLRAKVFYAVIICFGVEEHLLIHERLWQGLIDDLFMSSFLFWIGF